MTRVGMARSGRKLAQAWGAPRGFTAGPGGWIYNVAGTAVAHGWVAFYTRFERQIGAALADAVEAGVRALGGVTREGLEAATAVEQFVRACGVYSYWLPTRPYNVIAAINRMAAATGSPRYAALAADADYNGHYVRVYYNDYRGYWLAEYTWSGRNVLARGSLTDCLRAAKAEYDRGALGAEVSVTVEAADRAVVEAAGFVRMSGVERAAHRAAWWTPLHDEVNEAMTYERQLGVPAVGYLANSKTIEEYQAKIEACLAERRARRAS